jgi:hypothetical protein
VALCLCPSATDPTPLALLLKTKVKPKFDRAVTDRSKPFFSVFHGSNSSQFQLLFSSFTVRSAEGYKPFQLPCSNSALASGQQLGASSFFVKELALWHAKRAISLYRILFAFVKCLLARKSRSVDVARNFRIARHLVTILNRDFPEADLH